MTPMSFSTVLNLAKMREQDALQYICITYHPVIFRYVSRKVPYHLAEDITQDIFFNMVTDIHKLRADNEAEFRAWLFAITYTAIAAYHRRSEREKVHVVPIDDAYSLSSPDDPTQPLLEAEKLTAVTGAISMLTTKRRKVVIGRVVQDQPARALAQQLGKSEAAVYQIQSRALKDLRRDKNLRQQWFIRIILMFMAGSLFLLGGIACVGNAGPGNPLYPVRQLWAADSGTGNHRNTFPRLPVFTPTIAPTATMTPTPSPTPIPITRPPLATSGTKGGILNSVATVLPVTSSDGTPVTCVLDACVSLP